ncbi:hypothetical protein [Xanthobacter autotrophicus]|uniref:hypothetical protein n=1 Tax=Xanthobacter autotrophicus TaxID=280 RepID=UPI00372B0EB0
MREYWSGWLGTKTPWTNGSGYRNAEVDALIEKAAVEGNPEARAAQFRAFQQIVQRDVPTLPLLELKFFTVHAANLKGAVEQGDQVYSSLRNAWFEAPNTDAPKGN